MKVIFLIALAFFSKNVSAQNNLIFYGGIGDGNSYQNYLQATTNISLGGSGDGGATLNYSQANANLFYGGNGDGSFQQNYTQLSINNFLGGNGDGMASEIYKQASSYLNLGGMGSGNSYNQYLQSGDDLLFIGGLAQGIASGNYKQESNDGRFLGGLGDGWVGYEAVLPLNPLSAGNVTLTGIEHSGMHQLLWHAIEEKDMAHYTIEHSTKNNKFLELGMATANNLAVSDYTFTNKKPIIGNNYYRLKIVNNDNSFSYSSTILLKQLEDGGAITAYPNPVNNTLNISIDNEIQKANSVFVYNTQGQLLFKKELAIGENQTSIITENWTAGNYFLILKNSSKSTTIKLQKL
jgi:hypothetical protein